MKQIRQCTKRISLGRRDLYWTSNELCGREQLLEALVKRARLSGWRGDFHSEWSAYDVELIGDRWHDIRIQTATEELGWPKRFTRVRQQLRRTALTSVVLALNGIWTVAALATEQRSAMAAALLLWALTGVALVRSIHRCHQAAARLVWRAGRASRLEPVPITVAPQARPRQQAYIQPAEAPEEPEVALYAQG